MGEHTAYCSNFNADASETVAYNNPLFPVYVRWGKLSAYPDYSAISHWHTDLEFILVKKGRMTYNVNGNLIELTENTGIMVNSRQLHYGFSREHEECEFVCILFSPELFQSNTWFYENLISHITDNPYCSYLHLDRQGWQNTILEQLDRISVCYAASPDGAFSDPGIYFDLLQYMNRIMKTLYENLPSHYTPMERESAELISLKNMIRCIETHFAEHIALQDISAAGACCKSRCSALFRKYLCDTPISYLTKYRLRKSLEVLLNTDRDITDIALACGFGGTSYYCETFRKYYGISPLQYRKSFTQTLSGSEQVSG